MNTPRNTYHPAKMLAATAFPLALLLTACGDAAGGGGAAAEGSDEDACEFPPEEIELVTGMDATSGYTTWLQTFAPFLSDELGVDVTVENMPGGGQMRALTEVYSREGDGSTMMLIDSADMALNQVMGNTAEGVDINDMPHYGQLDAGPRVWMVDADSPVETFEDLQNIDQPVRFGANQYNPASILTFDEYDIEPTYILMDGTGEIALAVQRGDADVMIGAVTSVLSFIEEGDLKPILYLNSEEITEDSVGYEHLHDAPTPDGSLAEETQMVRTLVGPPGVPDCVQDGLAESVEAVNDNPEFVEAAEDAGLDPTPATREEAQELAQLMLDNLEDREEVIEAATDH